MKYIIVIDDFIQDLTLTAESLNSNFKEHKILAFKDFKGLKASIKKHKLNERNVDLIISDVFMLSSYRTVKNLANQLDDKNKFFIGNFLDYIDGSKLPYNSLKGVPMIAFSQFVERFLSVENYKTFPLESDKVKSARERTFKYLFDKNIPLVSKYKDMDYNGKITSPYDVLNELGKKLIEESK